MGAELGETAVRQLARPQQNPLLTAVCLHRHLLPERRVVRRERANYTLVSLLKRIRVLWCQGRWASCLQLCWKPPDVFGGEYFIIGEQII